jgi:hypothetical protein
VKSEEEGGREKSAGRECEREEGHTRTGTGNVNAAFSV